MDALAAVLKLLNDEVETSVRADTGTLRACPRRGQIRVMLKLRVQRTVKSRSRSDLYPIYMTI